MNNDLEQFCDQQFKEFEQFVNAQFDGLKSRLDPNRLEWGSVCQSIESQRVTMLACQKRSLETYKTFIVAADQQFGDMSKAVLGCYKQSIENQRQICTDGLKGSVTAFVQKVIQINVR